MTEGSGGRGTAARAWAPRPGDGTRQHEDIRALLDAARGVHSQLGLEQTLTRIARGVTTATGFSVAAVNIVRPDGSYETVAVEGRVETRSALLGAVGSASQWARLLDESSRWEEIRFIHHADDLVREVAVPFWRPDVAETDDPTRWHPDDMLFAPLTDSSGSVIGVLSVDVPTNGLQPTEGECEMLTLFAHHASVAIEHALLYEELSAKTDELRWAATHDHLTGLANRGVLEDEVPSLAAAPGGQLAVVVVDLDGFKTINDEAGHQAGDEVLVAIADRMRACVRADDLVVRTGGDEFAVIVAAADAGELAPDLVQRLARAIEEPVQIGDAAVRVGASIGLAWAETPVDPGWLLAEADAAMYRVKRRVG